jgi:hypothetical protein
LRSGSVENTKYDLGPLQHKSRFVFLFLFVFVFVPCEQSSDAFLGKYLAYDIIKLNGEKCLNPETPVAYFIVANMGLFLTGLAVQGWNWKQYRLKMKEKYMNDETANNPFIRGARRASTAIWHMVSVVTMKPTSFKSDVAQ